MAEPTATPPAADPAAPPPAADPATPPQGQQPPAPPVPEQAVPYERFKQVNDQLKDLKRQLATISGEKEQQATAQQTLEQRLAALEKERDEKGVENLRLKIASRKQLPEDLADRLRGTTAEELEADADRLLAHLKPKDGPGVPPPGGGGRPATLDLSKMTPAEIRKARAEGKI